MFRPTLEKIGLTDRDLRPYSTLLYGFGGDGTACAGIIELAVTLSEYPLSVTKMIDFVVVDIKSAYKPHYRKTSSSLAGGNLVYKAFDA